MDVLDKYVFVVIVDFVFVFIISGRFPTGPQEVQSISLWIMTA